MAEPNKVSFEEAEALVDRMNGAIAELDTMALKIAVRKLTAGCIAADMSLKYCLGNRCYQSLSAVKHFWDVVDEAAKVNAGDLVLYKTYDF